jgi:hypothetical protein
MVRVDEKDAVVPVLISRRWVEVASRSRISSWATDYREVADDETLVAGRRVRIRDGTAA